MTVGMHVFQNFKNRMLVISKSDLSSIDFAFNRFFMKLFNTNNTEIVKSIQLCLGISLPSVVLGNRSVKFELSFRLFAR